MAKVIDPDTLVRNTDVSFNTATKRITVNSGTNVDAKDGVTLKCLYSFCKEEWKNDATLIPYPFPWTPITDEQYELIEGWDFQNDSSRYLIRDGGWSVMDPTTGNPNAKWACVVSLGTIESDDQPYFQQEAGGAATNFQTQGVIDQPVQVFKDTDADGAQDPGDGDFDYLSYLTLFTREQAQIYGKARLTDIGVSTLANQAYRFPLATADDLNISASDGDIAANSPYTQILLRFFASAFSRDVDLVGTPRDFGIVIDVGTHSGVDGSVSASGDTLTSTEGGLPVDSTFSGGTLTVHSGANKGTYTVESTTATTVVIAETFASGQSNIDFTCQRATPVVASKKQIYEKVQYLLRQNSDIDSTTGTAVTGKTADELLEFVGATLKAGSKTPNNPKGGGSGVIIEGFDANDTNDLQFFDNSAAQRTFPFVAAGSINFNANLKNDAGSKYWMFFEYTERFTNNGFGISAPSGSTATLNSSVTDLATELQNGDHIRLAGFAATEDNGIWQLTGAPTGSGPWTASITKVTGETVVAESAGASVSLDKNPIDSPDAIIVDDGSGDDISGACTGVDSVSFDFDYDNNVQGGRNGNTPAAIVIRAIGLITAQFVETSGTITRATGLSFSLVSPLERNYANP